MKSRKTSIKQLIRIEKLTEDIASTEYLAPSPASDIKGPTLGITNSVDSSLSHLRLDEEQAKQQSESHGTAISLTHFFSKLQRNSMFS